MSRHIADPTVDRLASLYLEHPAWIDAARHLSLRATSSVYFSHLPGEAFALVQRDGATRLLPGAAPDPDLVFRFTPAAVEGLAAVEGSVPDFAVALFERILAEDPEERVDLRIAAGFARLAARGYVRLLVVAGPRVIAFGARHGISSLPALRRLVSMLRAKRRAEWESDGG